MSNTFKDNKTVDATGPRAWAKTYWLPPRRPAYRSKHTTLGFTFVGGDLIPVEDELRLRKISRALGFDA